MRVTRGVLLFLAACSGATDPNLPDAGASSSSSSSGAATGGPDAGPRGPSGPSVTPGRIACGASSCAAPSVCCTDGVNAECKSDRYDCPNEVMACDETADCAEGVCCAEESSVTPKRFSTYCRPTCITNLPRVQVCVSTDECATCKEYACDGFDMRGVKTCQALAFGACD